MKMLKAATAQISLFEISDFGVTRDVELIFDAEIGGETHEMSEKTRSPERILRRWIPPRQAISLSWQEVTDLRCPALSRARK